MKILPAHYNALREKVYTFLNLHPEIDYKKGLTSMRVRWDIYWASGGGFLSSGGVTGPYNYLDDNNIDTALRYMLARYHRGVDPRIIEMNPSHDWHVAEAGKAAAALHEIDERFKSGEIPNTQEANLLDQRSAYLAGKAHMHDWFAKWREHYHKDQMRRERSWLKDVVEHPEKYQKVIFESGNTWPSFLRGRVDASLDSLRAEGMSAEEIMELNPRHIPKHRHYYVAIPFTGFQMGGTKEFYREVLFHYTFECETCHRRATAGDHIEAILPSHWKQVYPKRVPVHWVLKKKEGANRNPLSFSHEITMRLADKAMALSDGDLEGTVAWLKSIGGKDIYWETDTDGRKVSASMTGPSGIRVSLIPTDPVNSAVLLGFATAGMFWTQVYPELLKEINRRWKIRNEERRHFGRRQR